MNRKTVALAGRALTPVLATAPGLATADTARRNNPNKPGRPKPRINIVTRFFSNLRWISVPATGTRGSAFPYPATIDVRASNTGRVLDVNLTL